MSVNRLVTASIKENIAYIDSILPVEESFDILKREIRIGGRESAFYFINGFTNDESMLRVMDSFFNIGKASVLNGFIKSDGIKSAVRSMAPEIIVCDEFGDENDISSALFAMKSGVNIVASIHAFDKNDLVTKPFFKNIIETGIFRTFVFLNKKHEIYEILDIKEIFP